MRFRRLICFGIFCFSAFLPRLSSAQFQAPTAEELSMTSDPKAPGADAVYLYREETEDEQHHFRTIYARIKVLTEKGRELAIVPVAYPRVLAFNAQGTNSSSSSSADENHFDAPDLGHLGADQPYDTDTYVTNIEVKALEARTIHPDGTILPLNVTASTVQKLTSSSGRPIGAVFTLPGVEVGSILEYRYQIRYDRFQSAPEWQIQQPYFVHKAHYSYTPADQFLPYRNMGGTGIADSQLKDRHYENLTDIRSTAILPPGKSIIQDAAGRYTLDLTDIPPSPQEPFAPPVGESIYQANFYYTYTVVEKEFWQKEMQYWTKDLNRYTAPKNLIKSTAAVVVSASDSPLDKARKLYALVQKLHNTDLGFDSSASTADDSIPNGNVETVLENKKGDSNQLAFLYLALVRAAGLDARPERIASRSRHLFSTQFLSTSQLDAVLIALNIDGKEILVDPGTPMAPFETLHWSHAGAGGVALGANGKVETILTPLQKPAENTAVRVGTLHVSPQGALSGTLKLGFTGQKALELRQLGAASDANAVAEKLNQQLAAELPAGIHAHVVSLSAVDDPAKQLVAVIDVSGSPAAGKSLALPRIFFESREVNPFPASASRTLPIDVRYPSEEKEQITYALAPGLAPASVPSDASVQWAPNAVYQLHTKMEGSSVTSLRVLAQGFTLLEAKDYGSLADFYQKVVAADQQQLTLSQVNSASGK